MSAFHGGSRWRRESRYTLWETRPSLLPVATFTQSPASSLPPSSAPCPPGTLSCERPEIDKATNQVSIVLETPASRLLHGLHILINEVIKVGGATGSWCLFVMDLDSLVTRDNSASLRDTPSHGHLRSVVTGDRPGAPGAAHMKLIIQFCPAHVIKKFFFA